MLKNRNDVPDKPGVYFFKSRRGRILYVGKAANLKNRLSNYFQKNVPPLVQAMLGRAAAVDFVVTEQEEDALLLEYNLIHTHQPSFNIRLKDDKSYPFIELSTSETYPALYFSRKLNPKSFVWGPITSASRTRELIDLVMRLFKIRCCSPALFKKGTPCLYFHIERCLAPCTGRVARNDYQRRVQGAILFLQGRKETVVPLLEKKMAILAEDLKFEEAQQIKEDLDLIRSYQPASYLASFPRSDYDVIAASTSEQETAVIFFSVVKGSVRKSEFFSLTSLNQQKEEALKEFILQFYRAANIPPQIVVSFYPAGWKALEVLLTRLAGRRIKISVPRRAAPKKILRLAEQNLFTMVWRQHYDHLAEKIRDKLNLERRPQTIEGYDVSHISGQQRVGAVVVFFRGRPQRHRYRSYIIKKAGGGDTGALQEMLERRFKKMAVHPDLLLIDGGKPQLQAARSVKAKMNIGSDLVALAKAEERLYPEKGGSLVFSAGSPQLFLFQNIRDEAHRRAVRHHRLRREKLPKKVKY